ncbi:MAG: hypothetical protein FWB95_01860 [Treponema sp.]|nr:hypothetical protein [Treponema sp.]
MPWRLIIAIIVFIIFMIFAAFNLDDANRCNISFGFKEIESVPVFLTVFFSFVTGFICATPLILHIRKKHDDKPAKAKAKKKAADEPADMDFIEPEADDNIKQDALSARERFFAKRRGGKK